MDKKKRKRAIEIQQSIRNILFLDWDPIGVNYNKNVEDEYDHYIAQVYRLLINKASASRIKEHLIYLETGIVGERVTSEQQLEIIVKKLTKLDVRL